MRGLRSTFILLLVLLGLLGYIYFFEMKRPNPSEQAAGRQKVFTVDADKIEEIEVKAASGERTVLKKSGGAWAITEPAAEKADEGEATGLTTSLASLEIQRVVDEKPADLAQFGLAKPRVEVAFRKAGQATVERLLLGDKNATGGENYAKLASAARVFLISSYLESTFDKGTFALRDKAVLTFQRDKVDALEIVTADGRIAFSKPGDRWTMTGPEPVRVDATQVEGTVGRLQTLVMKSVVAPDVPDADLAKYGLDRPAVTATVGAGSARAALAVGKAAPSGDLYARDVSRRMVVTVDASLLDELKKKADAYRPKDVFEFRSYTAIRIEVTRGTTTIAFEKTAGKDGSLKWKRVSPAKDVDTSQVDGLLGALSGLVVDSYVDAKARTGAEAPVAVVSAKFDDGKKEERVVFGKVGSDIFASRPGEPGAARVEAAKFDDAMKALDAIK
jgi:hypothetical protein